MSRASVSNIDVSRKIRQFGFLIIATVLGLIVGTAFLGKGAKKSMTQKTPAASEASFK